MIHFTCDEALCALNAKSICLPADTFFVFAFEGLGLLFGVWLVPGLMLWSMGAN
jgi:hypothetical protein